MYVHIEYLYIYIIQICNVSHTQSYSVKIKLCKSIEHILKNSNLISSPLAVRDLEVTLGIRTGTPSEVLRVWSCRGATCRSRRSAEFRRVPHKPWRHPSECPERKAEIWNIGIRSECPQICPSVQEKWWKDTTNNFKWPVHHVLRCLVLHNYDRLLVVQIVARSFRAYLPPSPPLRPSIPTCVAIVTLAIAVLPLFLFLLLLLVASVSVAACGCDCIWASHPMSLRSYYSNPCQSLSMKHSDPWILWMIMPLASWTSSPSSPHWKMEDAARGNTQPYAALLGSVQVASTAASLTAPKGQGADLRSQFLSDSSEFGRSSRFSFYDVTMTSVSVGVFRKCVFVCEPCEIYKRNAWEPFWIRATEFRTRNPQVLHLESLLNMGTDFRCHVALTSILVL